MRAPVLIMAGGTGGHIFPGLAVARALAQHDVPVIWLVSQHGLENRLVPAAGLPLETIPVAGIRGKGALTLAFAPFRLLRACIAALRVLRKHRPRSVLSMGGFAAGPGGLAAWLLRRPLIVHEQNRIPGVTNRVLARLARRVLCGFPGSFPPMTRVEVVGNPVREVIARLPAPAQRFSDRQGPLRLLVLGGSQGARALNRAVPAALARLGHPDIEVRHQCGARMLDDARKAYEENHVAASVEPFIDDMAAAYAWADLVVCRAGALTLAELAAAGVGAVLVPFPHAVDDHQTRNAEYLVEAGAARLLAEAPDLDARLADTLKPLIGDRAELLRMAEAARGEARVDSAERVAAICLETTQ